MLGMYFKNTFPTAKATKKCSLQPVAKCRYVTEESEGNFPSQLSWVTRFITDERQGMQSPGH